MRTNKLQLSIGEFSKLNQVTVKTLRHYEKIGLLLPAEIDESSGYRYYHISQFQKLQSILSMKEMGFALDEIKALFEQDSQIPDVEFLNKKIETCELELAKLKRRKQQLVNWVNSQKKLNQMEKFSIQKLPSVIVASHRAIIKNYGELGNLCCNVIGPEMARLGCKCPQPGYAFTFEHAKEYKPTDIDIEYCEAVEEMGQDSNIIKFKKLPEVPTAVCMKCYGPYEKLYQNYVELFEYIEKNGYKIIDAPRANYIDGIWNESDPEKWLTIIQVPVEK